MPAVKRVVSTAFWTDSKVDSFSPEDKYFMLYLLTNPHTTQLGIYELPPKHAAFELGYSVESVMVLLDRFESKYKIIKRSKETNEIAIRNYLKHSIVKGGKPVLDCLNKELGQVKDKDLIRYVCSANKKNENTTVSQFITHTEDIYLSKSTENENDNENDNDNERIVHDSSAKRKTFKKPSIQEVSDYCQSRRNNVDPNRFVDYYTANGWMVGKNHMKNWKAAVRTWERNDKSSTKQQGSAPKSSNIFMEIGREEGIF